MDITFESIEKERPKEEDDQSLLWLVLWNCYKRQIYKNFSWKGKISSKERRTEE